MPSPTYDPNHPASSLALEELRAELEAIPRAELEPIRLDIGPAMIKALGVAPKAQRYRDEVVATFGPRAAEPIDRLETSARACGHAHAMYLTVLHASVLADRVAELSRARRVLMLEAEGLVAKKRIAASSLAEIVGGVGYQAMCFDVLQLVSVFRADWAAIEAHTPVTLLELDQAEASANALASTLGENEQASAGSPAAELRQRAYTHFVRTYDQVQRAVWCLRLVDEDDGDEIVPSLFGGRRRRRADDTEIDAPVVTPIVPIVPIVAGPTTGPSPVAPFNPDLPGAPPFVTS
jgi:hypothetical protein